MQHDLIRVRHMLAVKTDLPDLIKALEKITSPEET